MRFCIAQSAYESVRESLEIELHLTEIALAPLEAEPVLYAAEETLAYAKQGELHLTCLSEPMGDAVIPLFIAPPAPVVPDECKESPAYVKVLTKEGAYIWGFNACRAAMLQGSQPVSNRDELPFEQWLSQQNGKIDVDCGCVTTEAFSHWLRVAYEAGNPPVIPDGCLWTYCEHDYHWETACGNSWTFIDGGPEENGVKFCQGCGKPVVLAAAPQQQD